MKKENENVVATTQVENPEQFVNENISAVPTLRMKKFKLLSLDEQVVCIQHYMDIRKRRQEWEERTRVVNRVKDIFKRRRATVKDAQDVIAYCEEYISNFKQMELDKLDEEIRKLQEKRAALQG